MGQACASPEILQLLSFLLQMFESSAPVWGHRVNTWGWGEQSTAHWLSKHPVRQRNGLLGLRVAGTSTMDSQNKSKRYTNHKGENGNNQSANAISQIHPPVRVSLQGNSSKSSCWHWHTCKVGKGSRSELSHYWDRANKTTFWFLCCLTT